MERIDVVTIDGKVDFVIKNGDRLWVVEFLICGDEKYDRSNSCADEHVERFQKKYRNFSHFEYLVVDFRPGRAAPKQTVQHDRYWLVYYDISAGCFDLVTLAGNTLNNLLLP